MPHYTDITGLAGVACAITSSLLLLPGVVRLSKSYRAISMGAVFALMLIPFGEMPLAAYVRGVSGDLSITTLALLCGVMIRPWCSCVVVEAKRRLVLWTCIAFAAIALYPMALGVSMYDPYRLGYGNPQFVAMLLLIVLAAWFWKFSRIVLCISFAVFAWAIGWYESNNLWDYLLDPFVSIYALAAVMMHVIKAPLYRSSAHRS
jgi:hypothetical protein